MGRPALLLVAAGLVAPTAAGLVVPGPAAAAGFHVCAGSFSPDGTPGGGFYGRVRAKRIGCTAARAVTRAWVVHEAGTDGANPTARVRIKGYSCRGRAVRTAPADREGGLSVLCTRGLRAVAFFGHP